ncbi:uncharacterized protein LOC142354569 isoform X2 [Convolutriloba macropyga]|uniref:uncharacterized protein LOC142354569 isoform X2 n=1 Tax=Convolutriloba macropyga TaxID=536237 RepID=UPI003F520408
MFNEFWPFGVRVITNKAPQSAIHPSGSPPADQTSISGQLQLQNGFQITPNYLPEIYNNSRYGYNLLQPNNNGALHISPESSEFTSPTHENHCFTCVTCARRNQQFHFEAPHRQLINATNHLYHSLIHPQLCPQESVKNSPSGFITSTQPLIPKASPLNNSLDQLRSPRGRSQSVPLTPTRSRSEPTICTSSFEMPPKRKEPLVRISPNARWDQVFNSAVTILFFSTVNVVLSVVDYQLENDTTIWLPLVFILASLYNKLVAIFAMWVFRRRHEATTYSILATLCLSVMCTLSSIGLVIVSTYALANRKGTFDYVRTGVTQRRYYQSTAERCTDNCTSNWLVLMLVSCGFFVNGAISIYLNAILKSQFGLARREALKRRAANNASREHILSSANQNHTKANGQIPNGHIPNGDPKNNNSDKNKQYTSIVPKLIKQASTPTKQKSSSSKAKRKAVSVTTNPYIGFQLGKLITEEYIEVPLDLFNTLNHHQLSNQQSISANCIRDDVSPQPRLGASLPTITQQASVEFSPSRLALDHVYSPSHIVQSHFQNDVTLPRLGSNSSESLTAFFVANQSSDVDNNDARKDLELTTKSDIIRTRKTADRLFSPEEKETLIDFESPPSVIGSPFSAFSPLEVNHIRRFSHDV